MKSCRNISAKIAFLLLVICFEAKASQESSPNIDLFDVSEMTDTSSQNKGDKLNISLWNDSAMAWLCEPPKRPQPWRALAENVGANLFFHLSTRYLANEDYAHISWSSIKKNFKTGFIWDNDNFKTNLFSHPYQGNLYFNTARTNGLNFWQSAPFALLGSSVWEMFMETQPPSTNDIIVTTLGGIGLGETCYRLSSVVLRGDATGGERVWREICGAILNPVRGFNRLITGEAWKPGHKYVDREAMTPFHAELSGGYRMLNDINIKGSESKSLATLGFTFQYGNPFEEGDNKPFSYFAGKLGMSFFANQPHVSEAKFCALIWGSHFRLRNSDNMLFGIFQNFDFYNSESLDNDKENIPYRIAETVAYGPGLMTEFPITEHNKIRFDALLSGVVLGGALSDHFLFQDRDYNLGSGFSYKVRLSYHLWRLRVSAYYEYYRLYTWKGYEQKDFRSIDPNYLNAQGAAGNTRFSIAGIKGIFRLYRHLGISLECNWYYRKSHYKYFNDTNSHTFELTASATYTF